MQKSCIYGKRFVPLQKQDKKRGNEVSLYEMTSKKLNIMIATIFATIQTILYWAFYIVIVGGLLVLFIGQQIQDSKVIIEDIKAERAERKRMNK